MTEVAGRLDFGKPRTLISGSVLTAEPAPDGQRFYVQLRRSDASSPPITVVTNWDAELSRPR